MPHEAVAARADWDPRLALGPRVAALGASAGASGEPVRPAAEQLWAELAGIIDRLLAGSRAHWNGTTWPCRADGTYSSAQTGAQLDSFRGQHADDLYNVSWRLVDYELEGRLSAINGSTNARKVGNCVEWWSGLAYAAAHEDKMNAKGVHVVFEPADTVMLWCDAWSFLRKLGLHDCGLTCEACVGKYQHAGWNVETRRATFRPPPLIKEEEDEPDQEPAAMWYQAGPGPGPEGQQCRGASADCRGASAGRGRRRRRAGPGGPTPADQWTDVAWDTADKQTQTDEGTGQLTEEALMVMATNAMSSTDIGVLNAAALAIGDARENGMVLCRPLLAARERIFWQLHNVHRAQEEMRAAKLPPWPG